MAVEASLLTKNDKINLIKLLVEGGWLCELFRKRW